MGDVFTYLVDGTSGLAPGGVDGKALVTGVCSLGTPGKAYLLDKYSDIESMLGVGPLADRVKDMLATGGQSPVIVAVPVAGRPGGYISDPVCTGSKTGATVVGVPAQNASVVVKVTEAGPVGTAKVKVSLDGGQNYDAPEVSSTTLVLGETGVSLCFAAGATLDVDAEYRLTVRTAIGPVSRVGSAASPLLQVAGDVLAGAELMIQVVRAGGRNEGTYQLSTDGGDNYGKIRTIPVDGAVSAPEVGVAITFPEGEYAAGTTYECRLLPPVQTIVDVMEALEHPLSLYDVEFVYVVGPSDSVDWAAGQAKAVELWDEQKPTYFKFESRLPYDDEDLNDFTAYLLAERQNVAARFVQVCVQYGEVSDANGVRKLRSWGGLQAGRVVGIPVQRATGRVKDGPISQATLPTGWSAVQKTLEDAGYLTAKKYNGLNGVYWGDSRTLAEDTSDYRYEEVLRVVFKAIRKMRIAALASLYDEAGDPLRPTEDDGTAYLKANIENALDTMTTVRPKELAAHDVDIPSGQDIANNGIDVLPTLIGIPIIREIRLHAKYVYAGSRWDPRMDD
ncbi:BNR/Asp-box repeat protein [uncultured Desulfovibrio sp.]|uniref:BNR/Asp-box repeat protein n=1 Tax=uncultured Desulfovibrio sp. TaxID=167968 RepID=A0A212K6H6_9BACT|nr:DUF2586 domain-containing protein [uncultured Desulfovibrio sp.]SBW07300.1 BNR/Asp-box repeat protein [uncultured Desulfovibrio sp.]